MRFLTYIALNGWAKYSAGEFSLRTDVRTQDSIVTEEWRDASLRGNTRTFRCN